MCRWNGLPQIHNHHYSHTSIVSFFCVLFLTPSEPHRNGRSCEIDVWRVKCLNIVGPWQIKFLFWFAEWFVIQNYHISTVWNISIRFASRGPKKAVRWRKRKKNGESSTDRARQCNGCGGVVAWLRSSLFFFRLSICISLAFINCLFRVAFLPAMKGLHLLFGVENYHDHRWDKSFKTNGRTWWSW